MEKLKLGDLVTIEPYGLVTGFSMPTAMAKEERLRITFPSGDDVYLPVSYLLPAPKPGEGDESLPHMGSFGQG